MTEVTVKNVTLNIPDCARGGDHEAILRRGMKMVIADKKVVSDEKVCTSCEQVVFVSREFSPRGFMAELRDKFNCGQSVSSFLGMFQV